MSQRTELLLFLDPLLHIYFFPIKSNPMLVEQEWNDGELWARPDSFGTRECNFVMDMADKHTLSW